MKLNYFSFLRTKHFFQKKKKNSMWKTKCKITFFQKEERSSFEEWLEKKIWKKRFTCGQPNAFSCFSGGKKVSSKMKKKKNQDEKIEFQKPFFRKTPFLRKHFFLSCKTNAKWFFFRFQTEKNMCMWENKWIRKSEYILLGKIFFKKNLFQKNSFSEKIFLCHIENQIQFFIQKEK